MEFFFFFLTTNRKDKNAEKQSLHRKKQKAEAANMV